MATTTKVDPSTKYTCFPQKNSRITTETGQKEVSNWTKIQEWAQANKADIYLVLLITSLSVMMLSAGLGIGAAAGGKLFISKSQLQLQESSSSVH